MKLLKLVFGMSCLCLAESVGMYSTGIVYMTTLLEQFCFIVIFAHILTHTENGTKNKKRSNSNDIPQ